MTNANLESILGAKTISFNATFAKMTGSVTAAVFLSQALFWQVKAKFKSGEMEFEGEPYFSKTGAEWFEETGLSAEQQKTARKQLVAAGILKERRAGLPAKMYFRVDIEALVSGVSGYLNTGVTVSGFSGNKKTENPRTGSGKFRKQEAGNSGSNIIVESFESSESGGERLTPPFSHVGTIQIPETNIPLEAEKKENDFTGAGPGAEFIVTTITPQAPYIRLVEKVEIQEQPGPKTPTVTPGRRSQAAPTIHPENLQAFDHFSDPEKCRALWSEWIEYKWGQHRDKYKTPQSELVMLRKLYTWSHGQAEMVSQIIEKSVGNLYKGLIDPNEKKGNGTEKRLDLNPAQRQHLTLAQYVAQRRINAENRDAME